MNSIALCMGKSRLCGTHIRMQLTLKESFREHCSESICAARVCSHLCTLGQVVANNRRYRLEHHVAASDVQHLLS